MPSEPASAHGDGMGCRETLRAAWSRLLEVAEREYGERPAGDVTVTTFRVVAPSFEEACFECPHGVRYWFAPDAVMQQWFLTRTDADVARWEETGKWWA